jgi:hypothetical protein
MAWYRSPGIQPPFPQPCGAFRHVRWARSAGMSNVVGISDEQHWDCKVSQVGEAAAVPGLATGFNTENAKDHEGV